MLVVAEDKLVSVGVVMEKAKQLSLEIVKVKLDIARELMDADTAERSSYKRMELEILTEVNKFKALYPELQSPAADYTLRTS